MENIYIELKDFFDKRYSFVSSFGYFIGALNLYLALLIVYRYEFSVLFYVFIASVFFVFNFVFSAITSLYIDMQTDQHIRAKDLFYFYGMTEYFTLLLIPFSYFKASGIINLFSLGFLSLVFFMIWVLRIWLIRKKSGLGVINSFIAVFFPHILIITVLCVTVIAVSVMAFIKIYA